MHIIGRQIVCYSALIEKEDVFERAHSNFLPHRVHCVPHIPETKHLAILKRSFCGGDTFSYSSSGQEGKARVH